MTAGTRCSDEELIATLRLIEQLGIKGTARHLDISPASVRHRREQATSRNLAKDFKGGPVPPGYHLGKVTINYDKDGNVIQEWQRQLPDEERIHAYYDQLVEAFKQEVTPLPYVPVTGGFRQADKLALYPVVDVHLGQHSWGKETGADYDLKIAQEQFQKTVQRLMASTASTTTALIVIMGDFYHANDDTAQTVRSHNHLDVDGRHDKVGHTGIALIVWMIDMAMQKHDIIVVHVCRGNHDPDSARLLREALWWRYSGNARVIIDDSPKELWTYEFGLVMLSFTHGHEIKAEQLPGKMAAFEGEIWGRTKFRYGFTGHWHRSKRMTPGDEKDGAIYEILPAFTEKDAWNKAMGHASLRGMVSKIFDKHEGLKTTEHVNI